MISKLLLLGAYLAAFLSVVMGIFCFTSIPMKMGFWRFVASQVPMLVGYTPAYHYGIPWQYTWEEWHEQVNLTGKVAIVTGANSGIGYDLASALAAVGASVTMVCRSEQRCQAARIQLLEERRGVVTDDKIKTMIMDTSSLASVRAFAETYIKEYGQEEPINFLFMNAGKSALPSMNPFEKIKCPPRTEADGIDELFQVNYLGHHLLYRLLEPVLVENGARVIHTSSCSAWEIYSHVMATDLETLHSCKEDPSLSYGQSKLAQILWVKALTRQQKNGIVASAFHPGLVDTPIVGKVLEDSQAGTLMSSFVLALMGTAWKSPDGALTGLYLAVAEGVEGKYFHPQAQEVIQPNSLDEKLQDDLWNFSEELVKDYLAPIEIPKPVVAEVVEAVSYTHLTLPTNREV